MKTYVMSVARLRLGDFIKEKQEEMSDDNGQIRVRITDYGKPRSVPMISDMKALLQRLGAERPEGVPTDCVRLGGAARWQLSCLTGHSFGTTKKPET
jgi:hypothetical protein